MRGAAATGHLGQGRVWFVETKDGQWQELTLDVHWHGGCLPCSEEGSCCCCCAAVQGLLLLFCALAPEEVNEVRLGPLTPYAVLTLRHVREFFGVTFSIRPERDSQTIFLSCIGAGVRNLSKKIT